MENKNVPIHQPDILAIVSTCFKKESDAKTHGPQNSSENQINHKFHIPGLLQIHLRQATRESSKDRTGHGSTSQARPSRDSTWGTLYHISRRTWTDTYICMGQNVGTYGPKSSMFITYLDLPSTMKISPSDQAVCVCVCACGVTFKGCQNQTSSMI